MHYKQLTAIIHQEDDIYVSLCPELDIAGQGSNIEEAKKISKKQLSCSLNVPQRKRLSNAITVKPIFPQWRLLLGKLKVLSGKEVCLILLAHGFDQARQKDSHGIMKKANRRINNYRTCSAA